jgi:hypothetical protein
MRAVAVVVVFGIVSFLAGLGVLAMLGVRLFRQVRALGRVVGAQGERIADAAAEMGTIAPPER